MKRDDWTLIGIPVICLVMGFIALHQAHEHQQAAECLRIEYATKNESGTKDYKNSPTIAAIANQIGTEPSHTKSDCDADQGQRDWWGYTTNDMLVIIGFLQFAGLLGGIGVYLRQTHLMSGQLEAAQISAKAAEAQARTAEQTISVLERPRLFPVCDPNFVKPLNNLSALYKDRDVVLSGPVTVEFALQNFGRTPAILVSIVAKVIGPETAAPNEETSYPLIDLPKDRIIQPREVCEPRIAALDLFKGKISRTDYDDLIAGRKFWWLVGNVIFDDIWGAKNTLHFCWRYDQSLRVFDPRPRERNYAEREAKPLHETPPPGATP